jgi:hypothetical protein
MPRFARMALLMVGMLGWAGVPRAQPAAPPLIAAVVRVVQADFSSGGLRKVQAHWNACSGKAVISHNAEVAERCLVYACGALLLGSPGATSRPVSETDTPGLFRMLDVMGVPARLRMSYLTLYQRWALERHAAETGGDEGLVHAISAPSDEAGRAFANPGQRYPNAPAAGQRHPIAEPEYADDDQASSASGRRHPGGYAAADPNSGGRRPNADSDYADDNQSPAASGRRHPGGYAEADSNSGRRRPNADSDYADDNQPPAASGRRHPGGYADADPNSGRRRPNADPEYADADPGYGQRRPSAENAGARFPNADPRYAGAGPRYPYPGQTLQNVDPRYANVGLRFPGADPRFPNMGPRYANADPGFSNTGPRYANADPGFASTGPRVPDAEPRSPAPRTPVAGDVSEIPLQKHAGDLVVPVMINNAITVKFAIDSGASDVSVSTDIVSRLMRSGTLSRSDFLGSQTYSLADGSKVANETFMIHVLRVGDREIRDVIASVSTDVGGLLLGQSFLNRFKSWSIDNQRQVLVLK